MEKGQCKIYICKRMTSGNLFGDAKWVQLSRNIDGTAPQHMTKARLCYSDDYIYVEFICNDDKFVATMTEYNDKLYTEDVVEIFIDDDGDQRTYIEIEVNPNNAVLHYYVRNDLQGSFWGYAKVDQSVFPETEITNMEKGIKWRVFFGIPMKEFVKADNLPPKPGDTWQFNLYRIKRCYGSEPELSSYSETWANNFHRPEYFSKLVFE